VDFLGSDREATNDRQDQQTAQSNSKFYEPNRAIAEADPLKEEEVGKQWVN
jgi:hypothetical protein